MIRNEFYSLEEVGVILNTKLSNMKFNQTVLMKYST